MVKNKNHLNVLYSPVNQTHFVLHITFLCTYTSLREKTNNRTIDLYFILDTRQYLEKKICVARPFDQQLTQRWWNVRIILDDWNKLPRQNWNECI